MFQRQSKDAALFVYLAWGTRGGRAILACDQIRQAAYLAITSRTRTQFCHILAIGGTAGTIHLIARFPPSLPISLIIRMAQDAGGEAIARLLEVSQGEPADVRALWEPHCTSRTLCLRDASEACAYLQQQLDTEERD